MPAQMRPRRLHLCRMQERSCALSVLRDLGRRAARGAPSVPIAGSAPQPLCRRHAARPNLLARSAGSVPNLAPERARPSHRTLITHHATHALHATSAAPTTVSRSSTRAASTARTAPTVRTADHQIIPVCVCGPSGAGWCAHHHVDLCSSLCCHAVHLMPCLVCCQNRARE